MRSIDHLKRLGFSETGLTGVNDSTLKMESIEKKVANIDKDSIICQNIEGSYAHCQYKYVCVSIRANLMLNIKLYCHNS
ncbi:hypothetical protein WH47_11088 [Habropoda laboriosa]|uniref:Uncharacterized protein n=1 Tax=Habropoda laboriosa TaxID=597456 RepID=A0A0L7QLX7_9HYME|nr:hypothetical protein WH47_11088 [Habropoda laboriosa]